MFRTWCYNGFAMKPTTTKGTRPTFYNLNLSPKYVPTWGAWEVLREVVCNALDADPEGMTIESSGDTVVVKTTTIPDLSQMFVIGEGTKSAGSNDIGQFGEGIKMAALAAARQGDQVLKIITPTEVISFTFRDVMGAKVLHAVRTPTTVFKDFTVSICWQGIADFLPRILGPQAPAGPMKRQDEDGVRVFVKGIYVTTLKVKSIWDWNLPKADMNRDRSMVSQFEVAWQLAQWLHENMTVEQAKAILQGEGSLEARAMDYGTPTAHAQETLAEAFRAMHGENAVVATGTEADAVAARMGHTVVAVPDSELAKALTAAEVPTSQRMAKTAYDLQAADIKDAYNAKLKRLRLLDEIVAAPPITIRIFQTRNDDLKGVADYDEQVVWLSEQLFCDRNDQELVRTYLHELAHFMSGQSGDGTVCFENSLDAMLGRLGVRVLGGGL